MKFWVLVGYGANSVEVPSLIFSSREAALAHLVPLLGEPNDRMGWKSPDNDEKATPEDMAPFFTRYYGGCGGCYSFGLEEVHEGRPFVGFDLD